MYLYGAGGHAKVIADILLSQGIALEGCVDDNVSMRSFLGVRVVHSSAGLSPLILAVGDNRTRRDIAVRLSGVVFGRAVHPSAVLSPSALVGEGTVVMPFVTINASAQVGCHCIVNTAAVVEHDCVLEDFVHLSPHATLCGNVHVGEGAWIGAGATVIPGVRIGAWSVIGAGTTVVTDIPDGVVAVGSPACVIRSI